MKNCYGNVQILFMLSECNYLTFLRYSPHIVIYMYCMMCVCVTKRLSKTTNASKTRNIVK